MEVNEARKSFSTDQGLRRGLEDWKHQSIRPSMYIHISEILWNQDEIWVMYIHILQNQDHPKMPINGLRWIMSQTKMGKASIDSHSALHVSNHSTPAVLDFAKSRKLSLDRADPRNRLLLQKHEFFHSQKAQRMEIEEVLADHDSEDEIDVDVAEFEDMTMLDGLSNVTKDEKRIMHMWNSFVRKQRVLADAHIPWACKAFSEQHGQELVHNPALRWCWRFVMIKFWNHSLLDACTMNTCNKFLDYLESESSASPNKT